ncbi:acyl-CoA N-acyltransferases (NAT) superfamily protein [Wolffia australiana]
MGSTSLDFSSCCSSALARNWPSFRLQSLSLNPPSSWFSRLPGGVKWREAADMSSAVHSISTPRRRRGACRASRSVDLRFPAGGPEVVVREARLEDCWEVAETHCSSFFPGYQFPLDLALRVNRFVAQLAGYSVPAGCMRSCLVAVAAAPMDGYTFLRGVGFAQGLRRGSVTGILTVDTVADYLPRKGPFRSRRKGIAYISNVAVRESARGRGIGKQLVAEAEAMAQVWGCRAIALHCDEANEAAVRLYRGQGYKPIRIPEQANWPTPRISPDTRFYLMMKLLQPRAAGAPATAAASSASRQIVDW